MRRRGQQDNSSYLSDLAFLLIIFFILLAGSTTIRELTMDMNDGVKTTVASTQATATVVQVMADGTWLTDEGEAVTRDILRMRLQQQSENNTMYLVIDPATAWRHVTPLLSLCEESGIPVFMEERV